jgi:hypothetical protein
VKRGLKVDPSEPASIVCLGGEDVGNEMLPMEEPVLSEDVQHLED